jgi:hypothetical protein
VIRLTFLLVKFGIIALMNILAARIIGVGTLLALAGCSWFPFFGTETEEDAYTIVKQMQETASVDQAAAVKLTDLPVRVNYAFKSKPMADHDLEVEVEYMALKDLASLQLDYRTSEGLALVRRASPLQYQTVKRYDIVTQRLVVVPKEEGHYTLNIYVATKAGDDQRGRQIIIPIALGKFSLEPAPVINE